MNAVSSVVETRGIDRGHADNDQRSANSNTDMLFARCSRELKTEMGSICVNRRNNDLTVSGGILHGLDISEATNLTFGTIRVDIDYGNPLQPRYLLRRYRNHKAVMFTHTQASVLISTIQSYILAWEI